MPAYLQITEQSFLAQTEKTLINLQNTNTKKIVLKFYLTKSSVCKRMNLQSQQPAYRTLTANETKRSNQSRHPAVDETAHGPRRLAAAARR